MLAGEALVLVAFCCSVSCVALSFFFFLCFFFRLQVLTKMLGLAVERLETNRYMTPDEKYRNVRVVPHLLW